MGTITPLRMSGIFAALACDFLALKRAQGYKYQSEGKVLQRFCKFAEGYSLSKAVLTRELVLNWTAYREGEAAKSQQHRISCVKQFGKYLKALGYEVCVLPSQKNFNSNAFMPCSFTPYIFTHEEISKLFQASDNLPPASQPRNINKALPVLIRVLYGCGLRISEAVGLRCGDVDLKNGILTVREAKFGKDRLIPISNSLLAHCEDYREHVIAWTIDDDFFFMAPSRSMLSPNTAYQRFRQILWAAGITYGGKGNGPRLHDLRHTFAVHALQKWVASGEDLTAMLPVLSVFMGHKSFGATSRYLRLTAEMYPDVVRRVEETCAYAIPGSDSQ